MNTGFSVVLLVESQQRHDQLVQVLTKSCRDFMIVHDVEALIKRLHRKPANVLLFGLSTIEQNEVAYFRLLKTDPEVEQYVGSTLLFCGKPEVKQAFQLCRKGLFNDYFIATPLYDPYHLLLRFRHLKAQQDGEAGAVPMTNNSISAVCQSLEQIAQGDSQISGINTEMLQRLGETITLAMESLGRMIEQQLGEGSSGSETRELISRHSGELVGEPIREDVREAVAKVKQVTAEMAEIAIDQRVSISREHPGMPPRNKRVIVIEDNAQAQQEVVTALEKNECETVVYSYAGDFVRDMDSLSADIVMLDLTLPDMPAFHVIEKLKSSTSLSHARLFVMIQQGDREKVDLVMGMGVNEIIMKPIDEQMMAFKLKHY
ncbi:MAG: hypothetical protein CMI01_04605 [Oceanospirillaceae bacterium]|nr:hypothetical protein [Oceanospirillaceae bacterium]